VYVKISLADPYMLTIQTCNSSISHRNN